MQTADLLLFRHLVRKAEGDCGIETAALLVAEAEYPGLDVADYMGKLDRLGRRARRALTQPLPDSLPRIVPILRLLYEEVGFRGNVTEYYDPKNSFLNEVIDRRLGIPITLAMVLIGVCRRAGVEAQGISFPGHFLVRALDARGRTLFVDPFDGRVLDQVSLQLLYEQATGDPGDLDVDCLEPAGRRQILARLLNNLRAIYEVRGDSRRLRRVLQKMAILSPSDEIESRLALLGKNVPVVARVSVN